MLRAVSAATIRPNRSEVVPITSTKTGADLITFDRHFESVDGLALLLLPMR